MPARYYAYGSNINKRVFEGRRRIKPAESVPAVLPGWRLTFAQPGLPFSEPAFAAVEPAAAAAAPVGSSGTPPDCHGVAHRITPTQWRYVLETEGASGQGDDHGYAVVTVSAGAGQEAGQGGWAGGWVLGLLTKHTSCSAQPEAGCDGAPP